MSSWTIDLATIDYKDREQTTKRKRKFHLDLALTCQLKGHGVPCPNARNQDAEIYLVFEHKSAPDKITLVQILTYCAAVWEQNILSEKRAPVPIIPIVFYHGKEQFKLPRQFSDYFTVPDDLKDYMVNFRYSLFNAATLDEHQISRKSYNNLYLAMTSCNVATQWVEAMVALEKISVFLCALCGGIRGVVFLPQRSQRATENKAS